jgi:hypothetical protein
VSFSRVPQNVVYNKNKTTRKQKQNKTKQNKNETKMEVR